VSEATEGTPVSLHIKRPPSGEYPPPAYANQVQITFTAEDFTLHFGWYSVPALEEPPEDGVIEAAVIPLGRVVMPLNLMRNLVALIERQIAQYERSFGSIPDHPNKPDWMQEQEKEAAQDV
jgi:hypothetical protein